MTSTRRPWLLAPLAAVACSAWPQPVPRRVGILHTASAGEGARDLAALQDGLRELGHDVGRSVLLEPRWADHRYDRLPALARDLAEKKVALYVALGTPATRAALAEGRDTPVVNVSTSDPVALGFARSLALPGGNVTGVIGQGREFTRKWLELAAELKPRLGRIGFLRNSANVGVAPRAFTEFRRLAEERGAALQALDVARADEIQPAVDGFAAAGGEVLLFQFDLLVLANAERTIQRAAAHRLLCIGPPEIPRAGGVAGYGPDRASLFRTAATHVDKLLRGAKPGELPIVQSTKNLLVLNLKAVQALGLPPPLTLLTWAEEIIE